MLKISLISLMAKWIHQWAANEIPGDDSQLISWTYCNVLKKIKNHEVQWNWVLSV